MFIKQLSVFLENKRGRLVEITELIAQAGIDLRAVSLADTSDFGILRVIVDKPDEAEKVLRAAGHTVALTDVIAVGLKDDPGQFSKAIKVLAENNIQVEYMYAFTGNHQGTAYVIMKLDDLDAGIKALNQSGATILTTDDVYNM
ncbi:ACT domain protein [[Clostridium] methylpentosum DSM 5476]|jgi:hypothetical protein|uniref:ACT domain protein n=1 Tax=[Clostridium] methylpentosum DSM 5476 TaxID=537013 RepID=C0E878_9FIRM|nr:ACT domain protein [[Clostridium] methylpentosum DSM 5476]MDY3988370.1 acetolactate synthase [Massilioclostridium sp.]MEE1492808.1 acetolactate synthase [Massilioclostridium sp.]